MSSRQTNDPVSERARRLAYQHAGEEFRQDRSFPRALRRVVEETIQIQNQRHLDKESSLTNLVGAEAMLQTLAADTRGSGAFSAFELELNNDTNDERSANSNY